VSQSIEPGPVVLLTTPHDRALNVMTMSWHMMVDFDGPKKALSISAPLIAECFPNIECRIVETRFVNKYCLFVLEGLKAWVDPSNRNPKTLHHQGFGRFVVDGDTIDLTTWMP